MKDFAKAKIAEQLLKESGVCYVMAYQHAENDCKVGIHSPDGESRALLDCLVDTIVEGMKGNGAPEHIVGLQILSMAMNAIKKHYGEEGEK